MRDRAHGWCASLLVLLLLVWPARAQAAGLSLCHSKFGRHLVPFLSVGGGFGAAAHRGRPNLGAAWGVEGSAGVFDKESCHWLGLYVDRSKDLDATAQRWSVGPEIGAGIFGLDVGYLRSTDPLGGASGFRTRAHLTLGFVGLTAGGGQVWGDGGGASWVFETGILLKVPIFPLLLPALGLD